MLAVEEMLARAHISDDNPRTIMKNCQLNVPKESTPFMCRPQNIRQRIQRIRRAQIDHGANPQSKDQIDLKDELKFTLDDELFLWYEDDDDELDTNRILVFATPSNFEILNSNPHWYGDGTFAVAPVLFKQLFTLNVIVSGKNLPMVFALLPDKKGTT